MFCFSSCSTAKCTENVDLILYVFIYLQQQSCRYFAELREHFEGYRRENVLFFFLLTGKCTENVDLILYVFIYLQQQSCRYFAELGEH